MKYLKLLLLLLVLQPASAQVKKFGKVKKQDFVVSDIDKYKNEDALILFKKRRTYYEYFQSTGWEIVTKVHERIYLKNKEGFKYATKKILYYGLNNDEKVNIKAATYNIIDNKIKKTKLDKHEIYDERISKYWNQKVFTMPNLKKGSIVEWEYTIKSPYTKYIPDVIYKTLIPIKYLNVKIKVPEFYVFKYHTTPFFPVKLEEEDGRMSVDFVVKDRASFKNTKIQNNRYNFDLKVYKFESKDIAAIPKEPFVTDLNNYLGKVQFELSFIKYPNEPIKFVSTTWEDVCKTIYFDSKFGGEIKKYKYYEKDLADLIKDDSLAEQKLNHIFDFVKNKVSWNNEYGIYSDLGGVANAYKKGTGNVAEINFILVSMLKKAGLDANPVLVSTLSHGVQFFPSIDNFNYLITAVKLSDGYVLMDPTEKYAPIGVLPHHVLNWQGRLVKKDGTSTEIQLIPKYYSTSKRKVLAELDENYNITGLDVEMFSQNFALNNRKKLGNKSEEALIKIYEDLYPNLIVTDIKTSNLSKFDKPFNVAMHFELEDFVEEVGDKLVFSPALFFKSNENIFKADKRYLPIYFGFPYSYSNNINFKLPEGYKIERLPESQTFSADD